jgi:superfamily II DNA or RNA helicase
MQRKTIEWQQKLLDRIPAEYEDGNTRICICAPCGAGKGFLMTEVADNATADGLRVAKLVNKDALIEGQLEKIAKTGRSLDEVAVIAGGYPKPDLSRPIWLCSIQTLARRSFWRELPEAYFVEIWMLDECHETAFSEVGSFICANPEKFPLVIGFTATPYRLSRQSLSQRFAALLASPVPMRLTPDWLAPVRTFVMLDPGASPDLSSVGTRGGDYIDADLAVACDKESLIHHAVDSWEKIAGTDKRSLVFGVNIEHASHLNDEFVRRGHSSKLVTGSTPKAERREMYKDFQAGKLLVLCSVDVISVGFDCVEAEICLCCRPTKSKAKYYQIVGRVGRKSDHTGKQCGIVIDQAGNALRLGTPDTITEYAFDIVTETKKRSGEVNMKACPDCGQVHLNFVRKCQCGYEFPSERLEQGGEMVEFNLSDRIQRLENKRLSSMQKWAKQAMAKGLAPGWATMKFKEAFGGWPDAELRLHAVYPKPTVDDAKSYLGYLAGVAVKRDHDRAWIHKEFEREFGTTFLMSDIVAADRLLQMMPVLRGTNSVLAALRAG